MDYSQNAKQQVQSPGMQQQQSLIVRVINLDINQPIDLVMPVQNLGGQRSLFITMLKRLEVMSLTTSMNQVCEGLNQRDWNKMKQGAHQLKGASGYVGAGRLHYMCYHIQNAFYQGDHDLMIKCYPMLVEYSIEFKRFSRKYLADLKNADQAYEERKSARESVVATGYTLKFHPVDDKIYCLKVNESIEDRIREINSFQLKPPCAENQNSNQESNIVFKAPAADNGNMAQEAKANLPHSGSNPAPSNQVQNKAQNPQSSFVTPEKENQAAPQPEQNSNPEIIQQQPQSHNNEESKGQQIAQGHSNQPQQNNEGMQGRQKSAVHDAPQNQNEQQDQFVNVGAPGGNSAQEEQAASYQQQEQAVKQNINDVQPKPMNPNGQGAQQQMDHNNQAQQPVAEQAFQGQGQGKQFPAQPRMPYVAGLINANQANAAAAPQSNAAQVQQVQVAPAEIKQAPVQQIIPEKADAFVQQNNDAAKHQPQDERLLQPEEKQAAPEIQQVNEPQRKPSIIEVKKNSSRKQSDKNKLIKEEEAPKEGAVRRDSLDQRNNAISQKSKRDELLSNRSKKNDSQKLIKISSKNNKESDKLSKNSNQRLAGVAGIGNLNSQRSNASKRPSQRGKVAIGQDGANFTEDSKGVNCNLSCTGETSCSIF